MVERLRLIYRTRVFIHQKCFGGYRVLIGSPEGVPGTPIKDMRLMGQEGKCTSHKGLVCHPYGLAKVEKERGRRKGKKGNRIPPSPSFLPPRLNMAGARLGRDSKKDSSYLGASYGCSSLPPTYIYVGGGHVTHNRQLLSRVRRPLHHLRPRSYFRSA